IEGIRRNDHRHAIMDGTKRSVGARGHDRRRLEFFAVRPHPGLPQTGKRNRSAGFRTHEVGLLACIACLPLVKAVGRYEATPPFHGSTEGRLVCQRFAPGIDQQREILRILDPGWEQSPSHQRKLPLAVDQPYDRDRLRRRDVVARREIGLLGGPEQGWDRFRRRRHGIAAAHQTSLKYRVLKRNLTPHRDTAARSASGEGARWNIRTAPPWRKLGTSRLISISASGCRTPISIHRRVWRPTTSTASTKLSCCSTCWRPARNSETTSCLGSRSATASIFVSPTPGLAISPLPPTRPPTRMCAAASTRWPRR